MTELNYTVNTVAGVSIFFYANGFFIHNSRSFSREQLSGDLAA